MSIYLGIDPGKKGGLAIVDDSSKQWSPEVWAMPELLTITFTLLQYAKSVGCKAIIEKAQPMPKQGVSSVFSYGMNYGIIIGMLIALEIPYIEVRPATWKKKILEGVADKTDKKSSIEAALRLFPGVNLYPTERSKIPSDGIAEAILIAEYGRRENL